MFRRLNVARCHGLTDEHTTFVLLFPATFTCWSAATAFSTAKVTAAVLSATELRAAVQAADFAAGRVRRRSAVSAFAGAKAEADAASTTGTAVVTAAASPAAALTWRACVTARFAPALCAGASARRRNYPARILTGITPALPLSASARCANTGRFARPFAGAHTSARLALARAYSSAGLAFTAAALTARAAFTPGWRLEAAATWTAAFATAAASKTTAAMLTWRAWFHVDQLEIDRVVIHVYLGDSNFHLVANTEHP